MQKLAGGLSGMVTLVACCLFAFAFCIERIDADEVLTLSGDNPNIGFVDNVAPLRNWQVLANDLGFKVRDVTVNPITTPFHLESGLPDNALRVQRDVIENRVEVGIGGVPFNANLHLFSGEFPGVRMRRTNGVQQEWLMSVNSEGIGLADTILADGDQFTIKSGAPQFSMFIAANGSVGLGTELPNTTGAVNANGKFFNLRAEGTSASTGVANGVFQGSLGAQNHIVHINGPVNQKIMRMQCSSGFFGFHVLADNLLSKAVADAISIKMSNGNIGLRVQNPAHPLQLASGAHVTAGGVFTNASSREMKEDIEPITTEQARETVRALTPVGYRYKSERDETYVGFIAEDVPDLVATKDRKSLAPMDITAVLTKVVQDQDRQLTRQQQTIDQLERTNTEQRELNAKLLLRLEALEGKLTSK